MMTERDVQLRLDGDMQLVESIDTTDFVIDFLGRKSISIGLDPSKDFNVSIRIIAPSRFVCITADWGPSRSFYVLSAETRDRNITLSPSELAPNSIY